MMLSRTSAPASRRRTISNQRDGAFAFPVAPPFSLSQIDDGRAVGALQMFDHQRQLAAVSRGGRPGRFGGFMDKLRLFVSYSLKHADLARTFKRSLEMIADSAE